MANTELVPQDLSRDGVVMPETATDETDWSYFYNDGNTILFFQETAGPSTVTIYTPGTVDGLAVADRTVVMTLHATKGTFIGPFPPSIYNYSDGTCRFLVSEEDTTTVGAYRLPA